MGVTAGLPSLRATQKLVYQQRASEASKGLATACDTLPAAAQQNTALLAVTCRGHGNSLHAARSWQTSNPIIGVVLCQLD